MHSLLLSCSYIFTSIYPIIQYILYPSLPHRLYTTLHSSPLLSLFPAIIIQPASFHQPQSTTPDSYSMLVKTWPWIEVSFKDIAVILPIQSSNPSGVVLDVGKGMMYTHKPDCASVPQGSLIRTGKSLAALHYCIDNSNHNQYYPFRFLSDQDDTPIFPRFIVDTWEVDVYSTDSEQFIANDLSLFIQFRPKVELPPALFNTAKSLPSEQHLFHYHPRFKAEALPNAMGLPMDITVETDSFHLHLLQSQYNQLLLFFFLNLGETPTICKDPLLPKCKQCSYHHHPHLQCEDCWCFFQILANETVLYPSCTVGNALVELIGYNDI